MWSLTLREEYKMKVFENRVLKGIPETNSEEMTHTLEKNAQEEAVT
jgi:hypothetical protein